MLVDDQPYDYATLEPKGNPLGFKIEGGAWILARPEPRKLFALEGKSTPKGCAAPNPYSQPAVVQIWSVADAKQRPELPLG